jgi:hypothetical protein
MAKVDGIPEEPCGESRTGYRSPIGSSARLALSRMHESIGIPGANGVSTRTDLATSVHAEASADRPSSPGPARSPHPHRRNTMPSIRRSPWGRAPCSFRGGVQP